MGALKIPNAAVIERDARAFDLRKAGLSYRQIARALDVSETTAYNGVQRTLDRIAQRLTEDHPDAVRIELERLDALLSNLWPLTMPHDVPTADGAGHVRVPVSYEAVDRVVKIMDRRAKLLGLDSMTLNVNNNAVDRRGTVPLGAPEGATGEITPEEEARRLLRIMEESGVLRQDTVRSIRNAMGGEDITEAEIVSESFGPMGQLPPATEDDTDPFFGDDA